MMTLENIRADLKDVRYYYARKEIFDSAIGGLGLNDVVKKVEKYAISVISADKHSIIRSGSCKKVATDRKGIAGNKVSIKHCYITIE